MPIRAISRWSPPIEARRGWLKTRRNLLLRRRRLTMFGLSKNAKILEIGCGDGLNLYLLRLMGYRDLCGIDQSEEAIRMARKRVPGLRFVLADAWELPFRDQSFDVILVDSVFHILSLSPAPLSQIKRVLTPGGFLCFIEPHRSFLRWIFDQLTRVGLFQFIPFLANRRTVYISERALIEGWFKNETKFINRLSRSGFRKIFLKYDLLSTVGKYQKR